MRLVLFGIATVHVPVQFLDVLFILMLELRREAACVDLLENHLRL